MRSRRGSKLDSSLFLSCGLFVQLAKLDAWTLGLQAAQVRQRVRLVLDTIAQHRDGAVELRDNLETLSDPPWRHAQGYPWTLRKLGDTSRHFCGQARSLRHIHPILGEVQLRGAPGYTETAQKLRSTSSCLSNSWACARICFRRSARLFFVRSCSSRKAARRVRRSPVPPCGAVVTQREWSQPAFISSHWCILAFI